VLADDDFRLDSKVAIVTGSGRKIGHAVAEIFAAAGAKVVVGRHRNRAIIDTVAEGIQARGDEAIVIVADVSQHKEVGRLVKDTVEASGSVDIVVSNFGACHMPGFREISVED
jgi:NAD(P)-dependent dehydrogenase (short-subunit alcohol dehydrogenase family)